MYRSTAEEPNRATEEPLGKALHLASAAFLYYNHSTSKGGHQLLFAVNFHSVDGAASNVAVDMLDGIARLLGDGRL